MKKLTFPMLISFEGGEGCGKSTQSKILADILKSFDYDVLHTRQPGGTEESNIMRKIFLEMHPAPVAAELLVSAAVSDSIEKIIKPALKQNKIIIIDRYVDSQIAYRMAEGVLDTKQTKQLIDIMDYPTPDLTFFIDLPPSEGFARIGSRGLDRIEQKGAEYHNNVYSAYKRLAESNPWRIVEIPTGPDLDIIRTSEVIWNNLRNSWPTPLGDKYQELEDLPEFSDINPDIITY